MGITQHKYRELYSSSQSVGLMFVGPTLDPTRQHNNV